jgi:hypothetical protein
MNSPESNLKRPDAVTHPVTTPGIGGEEALRS